MDSGGHHPLTRRVAVLRGDLSPSTGERWGWLVSSKSY
jgi:hypothetical protein